MWKAMSPAKKYKVTLLVLFAIWLSCNLIAPFTIPAHSVNDLTGKATQIDNEKVWGRMNPFAESIYFLGDAFCLEIASHSYYLNGNQMPFCARCTAIFFGLVIGMIVAIFLNPRINLLILVMGLLPMMIDGGLQIVSSYQSTNPLRLATGLLAGIATSLFLSRMANAVLGPQKNQEKSFT